MTKHKSDCKRVFKNYDKTCPRCNELALGAAPIIWNISSRKQNEARRIQDIKNHNCQVSGCGPICTFGDW